MPENNNTYSPDASYTIEQNKELYKHEQSQLKEQHKYQEKENEHSRETEKIKLGKIGQLFGSGDNASKNITATICILLIIGSAAVSLYAYAVKNDKELVGEIWGTIAPIITLSLGYLFGKK